MLGIINKGNQIKKLVLINWHFDETGRKQIIIPRYVIYNYSYDVIVPYTILVIIRDTL